MTAACCCRYSALAKEMKQNILRDFHIGFVQESEEQVNEINRRLRDDGYAVPEPARLHGSWTFYFQAPGGFTVEVLR
jgi:lactoylglutathione lyase